MMGSFLHTLVFFVIALGILIAFHEFGHFWVARKLGVKVLRFSIGFGKPLWKYQRDDHSTEYIVAAVPLGGYVKMVDEREGEVALEDLPYAFNRQSLRVRSAIVLAGPMFNLLLAVLIFWVLLVVGETGYRPVVGQVDSGTLAHQAGFVKGDEILTVSDEKTPTWNIAISTLFAQALDYENIVVWVRTGDGLKERRVVTIPEDVAMNPSTLRDRMGLYPWEPEFPPRIDNVVEDSPADAAGLLPGDLVVTADGIAVLSWNQWVKLIRERPNQLTETVVERDGVEIPLEIRPTAVILGEREIGRIGASVRIPKEILESLRVEYHLGALAALGAAVDKVVDFSRLTLKIMGKMLIGKASIDNLSGPISIAKYAGQSADMGVSHFLNFLAIVSISLGVLNLLPIPVLDGGHLLFFLIEGIKGKPVSENAQIIGQQVGIAILMSLMGLAFFLDIERLFL